MLYDQKNLEWSKRRKGLAATICWSGIERESHSCIDHRRFRHGTVSIIATSQPLCDRWYQWYTELGNYFEMTFRERVVIHEGVHGWSDKQRLAVVPCSHDTCQQVVAQSTCNLENKQKILQWKHNEENWRSSRSQTV